MYDYLIATDEGLAQSISENGEKEEISGNDGDNGDNAGNAKEDAELLGDSENGEVSSEKEDTNAESEEDSEDFALEDSSESENENENENRETQNDEYNVSRGIDFESMISFLSSFSFRRGCSDKLLDATIRFALRPPHWPNGASWKPGYRSLFLFHTQAQRCLSLCRHRKRTTEFWQRFRSTIRRVTGIPFLSDFRSTFHRSSRSTIGGSGLA